MNISDGRQRYTSADTRPDIFNPSEPRIALWLDAGPRRTNYLERVPEAVRPATLA
jgi:hypothetical protein